MSLDGRWGLPAISDQAPSLHAGKNRLRHHVPTKSKCRRPPRSEKERELRVRLMSLGLGTYAAESEGLLKRIEHDVPHSSESAERSEGSDGGAHGRGIPEEPQPHNALTGAKSHAEVISRLLYDKKLLPEFELFAIPWIS